MLFRSKKGQNVRLATRLVGWEIKIVSEELLKREIAQQIGKMMASGEAVPITALEGVTASQAETLAEKGVSDVVALAATSVDDLVDFLDVSMDEAEAIRVAANSIVDARNAEIGDPEAAAEAGADAEVVVESATTEEPVVEKSVEIIEEPEPSETVDAAETESVETVEAVPDVEKAAEEAPETEEKPKKAKKTATKKK